MPSEARKAFDDNAKDIRRLIALNREGGSTEIRQGLEVLNKSAIVLLSAFWEAYCEDIAAEGLAHLVRHCQTSEKIPTELKKLVAKELKEHSNQIELWKIADDGWRPYLEARLSALKEKRDKKLNSPTTRNIDELFAAAIGLENISTAWKEADEFTVAEARTKLDGFVALRGAIAHRGNHIETVTVGQVRDYFAFIRKLAAKTGGRVNRHVRTATGSPLWESDPQET